MILIQKLINIGRIGSIIKKRDEMRLIERNTLPTEVRAQRSECGVQTVFWICILLFGIFLNSCISEPSRSYKKEFVNTYAELTLLYEKEKIMNKQTDSSYQITLKEFFKRKGLQQEEFKIQVEDLSKNAEVWKFFIQDVSAVMDSLKSIK